MNKQDAISKVLERLSYIKRCRTRSVCCVFSRMVDDWWRGNFIDHNDDLIEYTNGFYIGETMNGVRSGIGATVLDGGYFSYGNWKNDKENGQMVRIFSDGSIYIGDVVNGSMNGDGILRNDCGYEVSGQFRNGRVVATYDCDPDNIRWR